MITDELQQDKFRLLCKLYVKEVFRDSFPKATIDKIDFEKEICHIYYNKKYYRKKGTLDRMLRRLQTRGIWVNYKINRETRLEKL